MSAQHVIGSLAVLAGTVLVANANRRISQAVGDALPLGVRNNNPGNIKLTDIEWQGKVPGSQNTDGTFEQFVDPFFGLRAIARELKTGFERDGENTLDEIIREWSATDQAAYIKFMSEWLGVLPDTELNFSRDAFGLVTGIVAFENSRYQYPDSLVMEAIAAA